MPEEDGRDVLRDTAEARLKAGLAMDLAEVADTDPRRLVHELQVHQIELKMQNNELNQARAELEAALRGYTDLYDFAPVGYLTLAVDGWIAKINLTGATLLGVERQNLLKKHFTTFVIPEDQDRWHLHFVGVNSYGEQGRAELALRRGDGTVFHAQVDCMPSPLAAGHNAPAGVRMVLTDISERKRAGEELRIAAIAFESQEGMIITDPKGVIVRTNQAFTRLTGYSAQEAVGQTIALLRSGRHDKVFFQRIWQVLMATGYWQGEIWNRRKDGKIYADWLTISAVTAPEGATTHYIGTFSEITRNKEAEAEIHRLAYYDPLTQLPNRRLLHDRIAQALAGSSRSRNHGALLFLDLDNFKNLNDTRGHDVGDQWLVETARRIQASVRVGDTVARLGGDEFVVMLEELSTEPQEAAVQAGLVGEKIREALARPYGLDGREFHCTASLGATLFGDGEASVDMLLRHADMALYKAKNAGCNTLRFFDPAMQIALDAHSALEADLWLAVERREFLLHYQPKVELTSGQVVGAEALIRWDHPSLGMVAPGDFIPLAEETGLILPIGEWVIETACRQLKSLQEEGFSDLALSVNLSARQFQQEDLVDLVTRALRENDLQAQYLELEITESAVTRDPYQTIDILRRLKEIGVRVSLDDFGTGYSSLNYLKRFPIDALKIDQSFVRDITSDPESAAIARTVISLSHSLKHKVIAEGVETEAQLAFLQRHHCDQIQGYHFSRPLPIDEFAHLLRSGKTLKLGKDSAGDAARTLLLLDDEADVLVALHRLLMRDGYRILTTTSAAEAFELLALNEVQVIVADQVMPEISGTQFLSRVVGIYPDTMRLVLSGHSDLYAVTDAINHGIIYKFLTKPLDNDLLREHIREAFMFYESRRDRKGLVP